MPCAISIGIGVLCVISCVSRGRLFNCGSVLLILAVTRQFSWSPSDNIIAYWTPEESSIPARVALMEIPSRQEIRTMNLFSVADVSMEDHHHLHLRIHVAV